MSKRPWNRLDTALPLAAMFVFAAAATAEARTNCGPYQDIRRSLEQEYRERVLWTGLLDQNQVLEIHATENGGRSWTAVVRRADGAACVVAAGQDWMTDSLMAGMPAALRLPGTTDSLAPWHPAALK